MAEIKIICPGCKVHIECDEAWCGHEIQCPSCQHPFTIPAAAPAPQKAVHATTKPAHSLVPPPPPSGAARLSAGATQVARSSFGAVGPQSAYRKPVEKSGGGFAKYAKIVLVLLFLAGTGVYFAYYFGLFNPKEEYAGERREPAKTAKKEGEATPAAGDAAAAPDEAAANAAPTNAPIPTAIIAPTYTLDANAAKIPEGKLNGTITGTKFVLDAARLDRGAGSTILSVRQGTGPSPDRGLLVYLKLGANEAYTNRTWTVSSDQKFGAPTVTKQWKTDPRYAPQTRSYSGGYAMKLELGAVAEDGTISGKIYLALPDTEQSVVAGHFKATTATVQAVAQPTEGTEQTQPQSGMDSRTRQRYGLPGR